MPNFLVGTIRPKAPANVEIGVTSTQVLAEDTDRVGVTITNVSTSTGYLAFGTTAIKNGGICLNPRGGVFYMDEYSYTNVAINGIADSTMTVAVQEFVR